MAGFSRVKPSLGNKDTTVDSKVDSGVGSDLGSRVGNLGIWDTPHSLGGSFSDRLDSDGDETQMLMTVGSPQNPSKPKTLYTKLVYLIFKLGFPVFL